MIRLNNTYNVVRVRMCVQSIQIYYNCIIHGVTPCFSLIKLADACSVTSVFVNLQPLLSSRGAIVVTHDRRRRAATPDVFCGCFIVLRYLVIINIKFVAYDVIY